MKITKKEVESRIEGLQMDLNNCYKMITDIKKYRKYLTILKEKLDD